LNRNASYSWWIKSVEEFSVHMCVKCWYNWCCCI